MLDTARKDGRSLRDWQGDAQLASFVRHGRRLGLLTGLAGSLRRQDIAPLLAIAPDYLGFRGALCRGAARVQVLDEGAFRQIREAIPADDRSPRRPIAVAA
jgi:uncharacterized protein (UPF0264 family)